MCKNKNAPLVNDLLDFIMLTRVAFSSPMRNNSKDLSLLQVIVLVILNMHECLNMTQISQQLSISNQQSTKLVATLYAKKYVEKRTDPVNRRVSLISLTEKGKSYLTAYKNECINDILPALNDVTDEQRQRWQTCFSEIRKVLTPSIK